MLCGELTPLVHLIFGCRWTQTVHSHNSRRLPLHWLHIEPYQSPKRSWQPCPPISPVNLLQLQEYAHRHVFPSTHSVSDAISRQRFTFTPHQQVGRTSIRRRLPPQFLVPNGENVSASPHFRAFTNVANSDYTGLPVLKAITSASEEDDNHLTRCWIYGHDDSFPFLFINGGTATISGTALGAAVIRDAVTQREVQILKHTGICHLVSRSFF